MFIAFPSQHSSPCGVPSAAHQWHQHSKKNTEASCQAYSSSFFEVMILSCSNLAVQLELLNTLIWKTACKENKPFIIIYRWIILINDDYDFFLNYKPENWNFHWKGEFPASQLAMFDYRRITQLLFGWLTSENNVGHPIQWPLAMDGDGSWFWTSERCSKPCRPFIYWYTGLLVHTDSLLMEIYWRTKHPTTISHCCHCSLQAASGNGIFQGLWPGPDLSLIHTSSAAQGGGGSFKHRRPIGEVGCCESRMAERIHWWTETWSELFFGVVAMFAVVTSPQLLDVVV